MLNIPLAKILNKLPIAEMEQTLSEFIQPLTELLPDKRLKKVVPLAVRGILTNETPVIAAIAQSVSRQEADCWAAAKRSYRIARRTVAEAAPDYVVVALDPVNFEKPYTQKLEGVSTVYKKTPPNLAGEARLARGYPALTAMVVNTPVPVISYASWFSYQTPDFLSQNREIQRSIRTTRWVFPDQHLRFVVDSGGDDQKIFAWMEQAQAEFVITATHLERRVEVYNDRLDRWESEILADLVTSVPWATTFPVRFRHAGRTRRAKVKMGWLLIRLPATQQKLWVLVSEDSFFNRTLVLLTNVPIRDQAQAQVVYNDWRLRSRIEHGYRFDQEQGLDVEDLRVQTLERMRRLFALVLLAAQFVFYLMAHWPTQALLWLRKLGGKLGLKCDRDGPYILMRGLGAVWQTVTTLSWTAIQPFPHCLFRI
jgi:hypothetical protein